jgi:hypothetical protein
MPTIRHFLTRRRLLGSLGAAALLFGVLMLHPYPRQSLFGPTIRGEPWCVWEDAVRRYVNRERADLTWTARCLRWLGVKNQELPREQIFDDANMLPLLIQLADDKDGSVREEVLSALKCYDSLHDPCTLPLWRRQLRDQDAMKRLDATQMTWKIDKDTRIFPVVLRELDARDLGVCLFAARQTAEMSSEAPELVPSLMPLAKHPDGRMRLLLMQMVQQCGKKGLPILVQGLADEEMDVRLSACKGLGLLGQDAREAVPSLEKNLQNGDWQFRFHIELALIAIDPDRFQHLKAERKIE